MQMCSFLFLVSVVVVVVVLVVSVSSEPLSKFNYRAARNAEGALNLDEDGALPWGLMHLRASKMPSGVFLEYSYELILDDEIERYFAIWSNGELSYVETLDCDSGPLNKGVVLLPSNILFGDHVVAILSLLQGAKEHEVMFAQSFTLDDSLVPKSPDTFVEPTFYMVAPTFPFWYAGANASLLMTFGLVANHLNFSAAGCPCGYYTMSTFHNGYLLRSIRIYVVGDDRVNIATDIHMYFGNNDISFSLKDCSDDLQYSLDQKIVLHPCIKDPFYGIGPGDDSITLSTCFGIKRPLLYDFVKENIMTLDNVGNSMNAVTCTNDFGVLAAIKLEISVKSASATYGHLLKTFLFPANVKDVQILTNIKDHESSIPMFVGNVTFSWKISNSSIPTIPVAFFLNTNFQSQNRLQLEQMEDGSFGADGLLMTVSAPGLSIGPHIFSFQMLDCEDQNFAGNFVQQKISFVTDTDDMKTRNTHATAIIVHVSFPVRTLHSIVLSVMAHKISETRIIDANNDVGHEMFVIPRPRSPDMNIHIQAFDLKLNPVDGDIAFHEFGPLGWCSAQRSNSSMASSSLNDAHVIKAWLEVSNLTKVGDLEGFNRQEKYAIECKSQQGFSRMELTRNIFPKWGKIKFVGAKATVDFKKWEDAGKDFKETRPFRDLEPDKYYHQPHQLAIVQNAYIVFPGIVFDDEYMFNLEGPHYIPMLHSITKSNKIDVTEIKQLGEVLMIAHAFTDNIYHFVVESLPRLLLAADHLPPISRLHVIVTSFSPFIEEILNKLGFSSDHIHSLESNLAIFARTVLLPEPPCAYRPTTRDMLAVRDLLWKAFDLPPQKPTFTSTTSTTITETSRRTISSTTTTLITTHTSGGRGVWISRNGETTRDVSNEKMLVEALNSTMGDLDWEVFNPSDHAPFMVEPSANTFYNADVLAAVHGAALTNIFFMRPGQILIELLPGTPPKFACFTRLAAQLHLEYRGYFVGHFLSTAAFDVDIEDLFKNLDLVY